MNIIKNKQKLKWNTINKISSEMIKHLEKNHDVTEINDMSNDASSLISLALKEIEESKH